MNNLKQVALAARLWAADHNEKFPPDFITMSNELITPKILVCNGDSSRTKAADWSNFHPSQNVTYEFVAPGASATDPQAVIFRCPIHGNVAFGDGSVQQGSGMKRRR